MGRVRAIVELPVAIDVQIDVPVSRLHHPGKGSEDCGSKKKRDATGQKFNSSRNRGCCKRPLPPRNKGMHSKIYAL